MIGISSAVEIEAVTDDLIQLLKVEAVIVVDKFVLALVKSMVRAVRPRSKFSAIQMLSSFSLATA